MDTKKYNDSYRNTKLTLGRLVNGVLQPEGEESILDGFSWPETTIGGTTIQAGTELAIDIYDFLCLTEGLYYQRLSHFNCYIMNKYSITYDKLLELAGTPKAPYGTDSTTCPTGVTPVLGESRFGGRIFKIDVVDCKLSCRYVTDPTQGNWATASNAASSITIPFSDYRLPTLAELALIKTNLYDEGFSSEIGAGEHWSSEDSGTDAYVYDMDTGQSQLVDKSSNKMVSVVRVRNL